MAVIANKTAVSVKLIFDHGVNPETGKAKTKVKSFANVRSSATEDGIYQASMALADLQIHPVVAVRKHEIYELVNEQE